jgi:DNA primase
LARLSETQIDEVRAHSDIVEVISRYLPLKKAGKSFVTTCPFHDDHNPSLSVSPERQIFKCFVCGEGGNVFQFVSKYENLSFLESVLKVAEYSGIQLEVKASDLYQKPVSKYDKEHKLLKEAIAFCRYQLSTQAGKPVVEYLKERGISPEVQEAFQIGYDPGELGTYLIKKGYKADDLIALDLVKDFEGGLRDSYANRLLFPLFDANGNPVGFSARALVAEQSPKYLNTGETILYTKGDQLFHYDIAKKKSRSEGAITLAEGVIDVMALYACGIEAGVAALGTALTQNQIELLKKACDTVRLCYDGDPAGRSAAYKSGSLLFEHRFKVEVVTGLNGLDPDEYRRKFGNEALRTLVSRPLSWIEFLMEYLLEKYDLNNFSQRQDYAREIVGRIALLSEEFDQQSYLALLSEKTGIEAAILAGLLPKKVKTVRPVIVKKPRKRDTLLAEDTLISQMLQNKEAVGLYQQKLDYLIHPIPQQVTMVLMNYYRTHDTMVLADFLSMLQQEALIDYVLHISESEVLSAAYSPAIVAEAIDQIQLAAIDASIAGIKSRQIMSASDEDARMAKISELKKRRHELVGKRI